MTPLTSWRKHSTSSHNFVVNTRDALNSGDAEFLCRVIMPTHSILITDHDQALSDLVSRALSRDGYEVRVAASSAAAIECAPTFRPELLVINPAMPNLSGVEAARQICRDTKCKVLFLTALARDPDFRDMLRGL